MAISTVAAIVATHGDRVVWKWAGPSGRRAARQSNEAQFQPAVDNITGEAYYRRMAIRPGARRRTVQRFAYGLDLLRTLKAAAECAGDDLLARPRLSSYTRSADKSLSLGRQELCPLLKSHDAGNRTPSHTISNSSCRFPNCEVLVPRSTTTRLFLPPPRQSYQQLCGRANCWFTLKQKKNGDLVARTHLDAPIELTS